MKSNIYVLGYKDSFLIQQEIKKIQQHHELDDTMMTSYSLDNASLDQVLEDLDTYSFLTPKKGIIVYSPLFLMGNSQTTDQEIDHFIRYLDHPHPDHILILVASKTDARKQVVKKLKQVANFKEESMSKEQFLKQCLDGFDYSNDVIRTLLEWTSDDFGRMETECQKLCLLKMDDKTITLEDVLAIGTRRIEENDTYIFSFTKAVTEKDKKRALLIYKDLLDQQMEPVKILVLLASQFRLLYQIKVLKQKNLSKDEIAKELDCHPYRIEKMMENLYLYKEDELLDYLEKLSLIDYDIKIGKTEASLAIELFILGQ